MKQTVDILIQNGPVMTMDDENRILNPGAVAIQGNSIVAVGTVDEVTAQYQGRRVIDATDRLVMPGLVDTYSHAGHGLIKAIFHPLVGWPSGKMYYHGTTEDYWYAESRLSAVERLRFGTTCGVTTIGGTPARTDSPVFALANARGASEVGIRSLIGVGPPDVFIPHTADNTATWWDGDVPTVREWTYQDTLDSTREVIERIHQPEEGMMQAFFASPYLFGRHTRSKRHKETGRDYTPEEIPVVLEKAREARAMADEYKVLIHTHIFGGSLEWALDTMGHDAVYEVLGPDVIIAHANGLSEREIQTLAETGAKVATAPTMEENFWYGRCPVPELLRAGVDVSITTDGNAPRNSMDLFKDISRSLFLNWSAYGHQEIYPAGKALRMVTIDAARVIGMADRIGSLEAGKLADVILIDLNRPHLIPPVHLPQLVAYYVNGNDVDTVLINGNVVMENRRVLTVDESQVVEQAKEEAEKALRRVDVSPYLEMTENYWKGWRY